MRVSVVVPVFDPGRHIDDLLASLRAQTLDPAEFEVVLVDDGSTDGTPALLDAAAAETANFHVIHAPPSGWPGRPRNLGIDAARGDFVFLADHDDRLAPDALQRLTDFAREHDSDVVIGRIVGVGRNAPDRIFARTVVDAQEDPALLMTSLTPQKLYRRAFLLEHGIRFPEGRRRLEDHVFVTQVYLRARRVSILAGKPAYYFVLRDDGGNASRIPIEWRGYFSNAAEAVALVDAEAPDEATRLVMRSRWLRVEAIGRLRGRRFLERADRAALLDAACDMVLQHYPPAEVDRLPPAERLIGRLLLAGRTEDVTALAEWEAAVDVRVEVHGVRGEAGRPVVLLRAEAHATTEPPSVLLDALEPAPDPESVLRIAALPAGASLSARFRHRSSGTVLEATVRAEQVVDGVLTAEAVLAPALLTEDGAWQLRVRLRGLGRPLNLTPEVVVPLGAVRLRPPGRTVRVATGRRRTLELRVEPRSLALTIRRLLRRAARRLPRR